MAEILVPKIGMTMTEATIVEWLVASGDSAAAGQSVLTIETDKTEIEVEAPVDGIVRHGAQAGEVLSCGAVVGWIGGESGGATPPSGVVAARTPSAAATPIGGRRPASPNARRVADELGVDISVVDGSGPRGRIVTADVKNAAATQHSAAPAQDEVRPAQRGTAAAHFTARRLGLTIADVRPDDRLITRRDVELAAQQRFEGSRENSDLTTNDATVERHPMSTMRRTIASRMMRSLTEAAQLTLNMTVRMKRTVALRDEISGYLSAGDVVPSLNDFILRATALALVDHPTMNARVDGDHIVVANDVHVGMAVAVEDGLIVPVVRHADRLSLTQLADATRQLASSARSGTLGRDGSVGSTFTVSNLGVEGIDDFTPILNPPNVGILGVGRLRDEVAWSDDGQPRREPVLTLSLTWDHRALDGVPAARFARSIRDRLESPIQLLV
ncbi:MAG: dihydrolipoamide acetyltransferase [Acidimicrobiaceae bacterium]|nr:dihydrolipoamide acetyltransferase [Acidimicrobiaceae bacterium]